MLRRRPSILALPLALSLVLPASSVWATEPSGAPSVEPVATAEPAPSSDPMPSADASPSPATDAPTATGDPSDPVPTPAEATPSPSAAASVDRPAPTRPVAPPVPASGSAGYIVLLRDGADVTGAVSRARQKLGLRADRVFSHAVHGYATKLTGRQVKELAADPTVAAIVPDERIEKEAQTTPTGISRVGARSSTLAKIDGIDQRVNADVAIVDTGIDPTHPDLNVVGGYNCSTSDRKAWRDVDAHGTHVAGTVAALDNGIGVVGVAPGARLWAVKILNDEGFGYLSWYVCGLDWIAAQRDPADPSRPLFEAVNMSVAKTGRDDGNCGKSNSDILHQAICRVVAAGIPVVAAAANASTNAAYYVPAAYNEVITVSALADTDGKPGGLGGNRCYSWGTYDKDDTFADFSNYGADVDIIAPGKCIWSTLPGNRYGYSSGTSMAAPHVTGAVALYKSSRPNATPAEVRQALQYLGSTNWLTSTDPDPYHERVLRVEKIGVLGDFGVAIGKPTAAVGEAGGTITLPLTVSRTSTFFEEVRLSVISAEAPVTASIASPSLLGFTATSTSLSVTVPKSTPAGTYTITVRGTNQGRVREGSVNVVVENDPPTAAAPTVGLLMGGIARETSVPVRITWPAATDATSAIAGYQLQLSVDDGAWTGTTSYSATVRSTSRFLAIGHVNRFRIRAQDSADNWSPWVESGPIDLRLYQETTGFATWSSGWRRVLSSSFLGGAARYATAANASARFTFTGRGVALVAPESSARGSAKVYVDGTYVGTVSLNSSSSKSRVVVYQQTFATAGTHRIELRLVGTSGHPRFDVDAFLVAR